MTNKNRGWSAILSLALLLAVAPIAAAASSQPESAATAFRTIEQPLPLKVGVTLAGAALIGAELWWFLLKKSQAQQAQTNQGFQEIAITVNGGYIPDRVVLQAGQPVRLNFFRKDPNSCLEKVLLPDFRRSADLSLNETTAVEFTPEKPGEYTFHCGMNMFRGVVEVH